MKRIILAALLALFPIWAWAQNPGTVAPAVCATCQTLVVRGAPGNLIDAYLTNNTGSTIFFYVFNQTTAPTNGSVTAGTAPGNYQDCVLVPTATTVAILVAGSPNEYFGSGVVLASSSAACGTLTLMNATFMKGRVQ